MRCVMLWEIATCLILIKVVLIAGQTRVTPQLSELMGRSTRARRYQPPLLGVSVAVPALLPPPTSAGPMGAIPSTILAASHRAQPLPRTTPTPTLTSTSTLERPRPPSRFQLLPPRRQRRRRPGLLQAGSPG